MGRILVGISSWADEGLIKAGTFYPPEVNDSAGRLRYYGERFPVTEIDSSFYAMPRAQSLANWMTQTPPGFLFDLKAHRLLTGHPAPANSLPTGIRSKVRVRPKGPNVYLRNLTSEAVDQLWTVFARSIRPLRDAGKLGSVLFQFPNWFVWRQDNLDYLAECRARLKAYRLAVEFRDESWLSDRNRDGVLALLRQHQLALVCVDEPQGLKSSVPPIAEVTAPFAVVRFHGRNGEYWEKLGATPDQKFRYLYSEDELKEWAPKIRRMADAAEEVHVILKNKFQDWPVRNAMQMKRLLEGEGAG